MKEFEKAEIEIFYFENQDFITTSPEHDNGYIDSDELLRMAKNLAEKIF